VEDALIRSRDWSAFKHARDPKSRVTKEYHGDASHLAFRVFCVAVAGAAAATLLFDFDGAFGFGEAMSSAGPTLGLAAVDFAASATMLLRSASSVTRAAPSPLPGSVPAWRE